jgi:hypothetical protein
MKSRPGTGIRDELTRIGYFLMAGVLATITMDLGALIMLSSGIVSLGPYRIVPNLLGRWVGSFPTGTIFHSTILETPPIPHEKVLGIVCHYLIGIILTSLLVYPHVRIWRRKIALSSALLYGIATCIFPYFVMFPAMGFGVLGLKLNDPSKLVSFSALNHAMFGAGIFIWSNLLNKPSLNNHCCAGSERNSSPSADPFRP